MSEIGPTRAFRMMHQSHQRVLDRTKAICKKRGYKEPANLDVEWNMGPTRSTTMPGIAPGPYARIITATDSTRYLHYNKTKEAAKAIAEVMCPKDPPKGGPGSPVAVGGRQPFLNPHPNPMGLERVFGNEPNYAPVGFVLMARAAFQFVQSNAAASVVASAAGASSAGALTMLLNRLVFVYERGIFAAPEL